MSKTAIAYKLKEYRIKSGMTQQAVASALDIERSTYTYYEIGKSTPSIENLGKLAKLFGVEFTDLLDGVGENIDTMFEKSGDEKHKNDMYRTHAVTKFETQLLFGVRQLTPKQRKDIMARVKAYMDENNK